MGKAHQGKGLVRFNLEDVHPHLRGRRVENHPHCTQLGLNPDLPDFGSLVQHESSALDHAATEAGDDIVDDS
ncbi:unnamed protein product [Timema podura]|uniref:Uncharacterized protein n=1 Tax=Timema podura TaxID=61482 RepID=A0ABN7P794_TIMPD|nr:unnamed protein product [Timema podura]